MDRRGFIAASVALLRVLRRTAVAAEGGAAPPSYRAYQRVRLTGSQGKPLKASRLVRHENYLFFYPYGGTPCFLLDLGREVRGQEVKGSGSSGGYAWPGGVGPRRSIVGYTAICPHLWSYPTKDVTVVSYHGPDVVFQVGGAGPQITCCAHGSCFNPATGGAVVQGPSELPLAAVDLKWEKATDVLVAQGMWGHDRFREFFTSFPTEDRQEASDATAVVRLRDYSALVARC